MKIKTEAPESKEKLDVKRRKCTLSEEIQKMLLRQLKHEMYNHNLYMSFSNFYGVQGLAVLEEYYKLRAKEEYLHAEWIRTYMNENDSAYVYPDIPAISEVFEDNVTPFKLTVDKEIETTQLIYEIVDQALEEGDWATFNWLNGDSDEIGRLVQEQVNFCLVA